jgi:dTDP-4-dehydrorhamnose reductase
VSAPSPDQALTTPEPEVWAGVEASHVRIGRRTVDQLELTGHAEPARIGDLDAIASLGVVALRYAVLWERVAPRGLSSADWSWPDERLGRLRSLGVRPVIGLLHHGSGPRGISLLHPAFPATFARYAAAVARRYPWVDEFLPVNEPLTTARFGGLYGWWQPHARSMDVCLRLLLAQCLAIRAAGRAIRSVNPSARIIVNEDVGRTFSTLEMAWLAAELNERRWLTWDVLLGRVDESHAMYRAFAASAVNLALLKDLAREPFEPDVLGVDHYVTSDRFLDHRVALYPPERRNDEVSYVDVEACRVRGVPPGSVLRALTDTWERYRRPIVLPEISLAGEPADQLAWWSDAWRASLLARQRGIDVRAVTAWAALGAVDWHCLMCRPDGIYEPGLFDVRGGRVVERQVAAAVRAAASSRRAAMDAETIRTLDLAPATPAARGWWHRPDRFIIQA